MTPELSAVTYAKPPSTATRRRAAPSTFARQACVPSATRNRPQQPGTADDDQLTIHGHDRLLIEAWEGGPPLGTVLERTACNMPSLVTTNSAPAPTAPRGHDHRTQADRLPPGRPASVVDSDEVAAGCRDHHRAVDDAAAASSAGRSGNIPEQVRLGARAGAGRDARPPVPALPRGHVEAFGRHTGSRDGGCGRDRRGPGRLARSSVRLAGHQTQLPRRGRRSTKGCNLAGRRGGHGCASVRSRPPNDRRESSARRPEVRRPSIGAVDLGHERGRVLAGRRYAHDARLPATGSVPTATRPRDASSSSNSGRHERVDPAVRERGDTLVVAARPHDRGPESWTEAAGASPRRPSPTRRRRSDVRRSRPRFGGPSRGPWRARRASTRTAGSRRTSRGRACLTLTSHAETRARRRRGDGSDVGSRVSSPASGVRDVDVEPDPDPAGFHGLGRRSGTSIRIEPVARSRPSMSRMVTGCRPIPEGTTRRPRRW